MSPSLPYALRREPRLSPPDREAQEDSRGTRKLHYSVLARVSLRHTYYNASGGVCPDFVVRPTGATEALMYSLGLLFRAEADGFQVLYDDRRVSALLSYLQRERAAYRARTGREGAWTRLSFLLSLRTRTFLNFTQLPIGTNPALTNFFLTNRQAHALADGVVLITPGTRVTTAEALPVTGPQLVEEVGPRVRAVTLVDQGGEVVLCRPRCVPTRLLERWKPSEVTCDQLEAALGVLPGCDEPDQRCTDRLFFDLSTLPEDAYGVTVLPCEGPPEPDGTWLYTSLYPMPLCFVSLLFSDPADGGSGIYPVTLGEAPGTGSVASVEYVVRFTRRHTWWNYYILPQDGEALGELAIEVVDGAPPGEPLTFLGPCRVRIAGGALAWRFLSSRPIPLQERSPLRLRLLGRTARMTHAGVLVDPLPVAGPQQVLPLPFAAACARARSELDPQDPDAACQALLARLCDGPPDAGGGPADGGGPPPPCFSDLYVHV